MSATAKLTEKALEDLSDVEFEALLRERRGAMKGLQMTDEQRRKAMAYSGSIDHGGGELPKR
jgi:hypothetical protein